MMQVQILDEAEQDLLEGVQFYENQISGLGQYFLDSLFSDDGTVPGNLPKVSIKNLETKRLLML